LFLQEEKKEKPNLSGQQKGEGKLPVSIRGQQKKRAYLWGGKRRANREEKKERRYSQFQGNSSGTLMQRGKECGGWGGKEKGTKEKTPVL